MKKLILTIMLLTVSAAWANQGSEAKSEELLKTLRGLAAANESSISLIKMDYKVTFGRMYVNDGKPDIDNSSKGYRRAGVTYSHKNGTLAGMGLKCTPV